MSKPNDHRDADRGSGREQPADDSTRLYRSLIEGSIQGLLIISESRVPLFANQAAADMFGYESPADLLALDSTAVLIAPHELPRLNAIREQFFRDPLLAPTNYDFEGRHKDGSTLYLEVRAGVIDWHGQLAAQITLFDVTERKRIEAQLQQAQRLEAIGRLTGGVAHDFNNLLSIILGNAELCLDNLRQSGRDEDLELVEEILRATKRGRSLMQQLLAFARQQALQPRPIALPDLLSDLSTLLELTLGGDITLQLAPSPPPWPVMADPGQLETALVNLALNARDAMPEGGTLTIACANQPAASDDDQDFVRLTVTDCGSGMTAEVRERAFEPFFTTKPFGQGSGLGLSMVYGFAKQSGGEVNLTSAPGTGTTVQLLLPRDRTVKSGSAET